MKYKIVLLGIISSIFISCALSKTANEMPKVKKDSSLAKKSKQSPDNPKTSNRSITNKEMEVRNSSGLICFASYKDEFSPSYIRIGNETDLNDNLFIGFNSTLKSYCKEDGKTLVQYHCDTEKENLVSPREIKCQKSCVLGACTR